MNAERLGSPAALRSFQQSILSHHQAGHTVVAVCGGTSCLTCGCGDVLEALRTEVRKAGLEQDLEIKTTGCRGFCECGPLISILPAKTFYIKVKPRDVDEIVNKTLMRHEVVKRLAYKDPVTGVVFEREDTIPFFQKQMRLLIGKNNVIDPTAISDYIALGGYQSLASALATMTPESIIEQVKRSGLRGRGGGGFPTGKKWASCRKSKGEPKYVICNADEGDPGAFMDRSLLEGNPHSVIEGMVIGAYAIGSHDGYVYVRNEYPLALKNLGIAIQAAHEHGLLGNDILGTGFSFDIKVSRGGGAFVCGESTALMASLEGKVGEPRAKYVHTVDAGVWDKPSTLNNVETWANVPLIIEKGADWYASIGTEKSKGTKVFALTGKVKNTGLVEVPMGMTLRDILYDIGGGVRGGKKFKAVQTGGPSGGTLITDDSGVIDGTKVNHLDLPVDFDALTEAGSMMGSGGMIVMDEDSCMVDVARYFLNFLQEESCGKCLPCREGIRMMLGILNRITAGEGRLEDLDLLEEMSQVIIDTSLCQLGGSAPNPVLSTMRYFRDEYLAHITDHRCPAGVCSALVSHAISESCDGCHLCAASCPANAIAGEPKQLHSIRQVECIQCGACYQVCNNNAVKRIKRGEGDLLQRHAGEVWKPREKTQRVKATA